MSNQGSQVSINLKGLKIEKWWQLCAILLSISALVASVGYAASQGVFVHVSITSDEVYEALQTQIGSSYSALSKPVTVYICLVDTTYCWAQGNDSKLRTPWGSNLTLVEECAAGNYSAGLFYLEGVAWNTSVTVNASVTIEENRGDGQVRFLGTLNATNLVATSQIDGTDFVATGWMNSTSFSGSGQFWWDGVNRTDSVTNTLKTLFGDGRDGDVTIGADTTLTRDMYYRSLTVAAGFTLSPNGHTINVLHTLTVEATGVISVKGGDGAAGAVGGAAAGLAGGARGPFIGGGALGGAGALAAAAGTNNGAAGNAGSASQNPIAYCMAGGAAGGGGGNHALVAVSGGNGIQGTTSAGGAGGAGTGAGATQLGGGGGGGGGGVCVIYARDIINDGTITANGGAGGSGMVSGADKGGNGGGGGGGSVFLTYETLTGADPTVAGGAAGVSGNGGAAGGNGILFKEVVPVA